MSEDLIKRLKEQALADGRERGHAEIFIAHSMSSYYQLIDEVNLIRAFLRNKHGYTPESAKSMLDTQVEEAIKRRTDQCFEQLKQSNEEFAARKHANEVYFIDNFAIEIAVVEKNGDKTKIAAAKTAKEWRETTSYKREKGSLKVNPLDLLLAYFPLGNLPDARSDFEKFIAECVENYHTKTFEFHHDDAYLILSFFYKFRGRENESEQQSKK